MALYVSAVVFLLAALKTGTADRELFLLTAGSTSDGVAVTFTPETKSTPVNIILKGESISAKCDPTFRRCDPLLVVSGALSNESDKQLFAFLPLTSSFLILEVWFNGSSLEHRKSFVYDMSEGLEPCDPTLFFESDSGVFMVCVGSSESFYYQIHLNHTHVNSSTAVDPLPIANSDLPTLSNVLAVDCDGKTKGCLVYHIGDSLVQLRVDDKFKTPLPDGNKEKCGKDAPVLQQVPRLNAQPFIAALCSEHVTYYDLESEDVEVEYYNTSGYPCFCPDPPDAKVSVYSQNSRIEYSVSSGTQTLSANLPGNDFVAGYCLGTKKQPVFLAVDALIGISAIDITANINFKNWTKSCQQPLCLSVATIVEQYVVTVEGGGGRGGGGMKIVTVLDSNQTFSEVIQVSAHADIMTVILGLERSVPVPDPRPESSSNILAIALPTSVIGVVVVAGTLTVIMMVFVWKSKRGRITVRQTSDDSESPIATYNGRPEDETSQESLQDPVHEQHSLGHSDALVCPTPSGPSQATPNFSDESCHPQQVEDQGNEKVDLATGHRNPHPPLSINPDGVRRQYEDRQRDNREGEDLENKAQTILLHNVL